jgi:hypothetical protein
MFFLKGILLRFFIFFALFLILPTTSPATDYQGHCTVTFEGSSTLHDFNGKGRCEPFVAIENAGVITVPELAVAVADMDTDNSSRDKKMRKMFEAERYPLIKGGRGPIPLDDIRKALQENSDSTQPLLLQLKIRDIEKPATAVLQNFEEAEGKITADLTFTLSLADYQLKAPSVLGVIKVADSIKVTTSFLLEAL